jgi:hypothetical protein
MVMNVIILALGRLRQEDHMFDWAT